MNILVLSWRDIRHPKAGGAEQVDHEHEKGWVEMGHNVTRFSSYFKGGERGEVIDGIRFIRKGNQNLGVHLMAFVWYLFGKHPEYDLVVDEFHGIPFFTPLYVRKKKLAVLQEVARRVWLKNELPSPLNYVVGAVGYIIEPFIFLFYKKVPFMVGSFSAKMELQKMGIAGKHVSVVFHGVVLDLPKKLPQKEKTRTVLFLGALTKDKGIEDAIRAFGILNKMGEYQFWVIGKAESSYMQKLKELSKKVGVEKKIIFWGGRDAVNDRKKFELLSRSHVMVNPSALEGWGLVNIEANSVGTPVVAYNSLGLTDSVKNGVTGIIVGENNPDELAKGVDSLLIDLKEYQKVKEGAVKWSRQFSWEKAKSESLKLIERL